MSCKVCDSADLHVARRVFSNAKRPAEARMRGGQSSVRRSGIAISVLFALFMGACYPADSQSPSSAPDQVRDDEGVLTFHAGTHLVVLDVVVTDKKGHPVPGLTEDDFKLLEDGRDQTVKFF